MLPDSVGEEKKRWHRVVFDRVEGQLPIVDRKSKQERRSPSATTGAYSHLVIHRQAIDPQKA